MARVPEHIIENVRQAADIYDVVSEHVDLKKMVETLRVYVHFIMKKLLHFTFIWISKYINVLAVEKAVGQ